MTTPVSVEVFTVLFKSGNTVNHHKSSFIGLVVSGDNQHLPQHPIKRLPQDLILRTCGGKSR